MKSRIRKKECNENNENWQYNIYPVSQWVSDHDQQSVRVVLAWLSIERHRQHCLAGVAGSQCQPHLVLIDYLETHLFGPADDKDHPAVPSTPAVGRSARIHPAQLGHHSLTPHCGQTNLPSLHSSLINITNLKYNVTKQAITNRTVTEHNSKLIKFLIHGRKTVNM